MSKIEVIDLKECRGDTEKISMFLNKIESQRRTYDLKSVSLTDDRNTAVMIFGNAEGMSYFNMLSDAADARKNENNPASASSLFNDAIAVLFNHTEGLVRVFILEKTSNEHNRWFYALKFLFPIHLRENKKIRIEIISLCPDDKLLHDLKKQYPDNIKTFSLVLKKPQDTPSFMVVEPLGYWIEILDEKMMIRGVVNFGDSEGTKKFIDLFDKKLKPKAISFWV